MIAIGELNISNLAKVKVFVQAKRSKISTKVSANTVMQLRQAIPFGGQGTFKSGRPILARNSSRCETAKTVSDEQIVF